jgi:hypothetical protein
VELVVVVGVEDVILISAATVAAAGWSFPFDGRFWMDVLRSNELRRFVATIRSARHTGILFLFGRYRSLILAKIRRRT